jgi:hypothetical protein
MSWCWSGVRLCVRKQAVEGRVAPLSRMCLDERVLFPLEHPAPRTRSQVRAVKLPEEAPLAV